MASSSHSVARDPAGVTTGRWIENRPEGGGVDLQELWAFREVGVVLTLRDLKLRYRQTFFGIAWVVLQPLAAMALFTLVLGRVDQLGAPGVTYAALVITGLAVWFPIANGIGSSAESLAAAPELVTKVYFPRLLAPLAAALATSVDLAIALAIATVVAVLAGEALGASLIALPVVALAAMLVVVALGLWFAALNVLYRDVRYALPFVIQVLFFASPIVYASTVIPEAWAWLYFMNPVAGVVELTRWTLLGTSFDTAAAMSVASGLALLAGGVAFFRWTERQFADRV